MTPSTQARSQRTRAALVDAAVDIIREQGYTGMRIDEVCVRAGVSKGAFFHHFSSKSQLAVAASNAWEAGAVRNYATFDQPGVDPVGRLFAYLDLRMSWVGPDLHDLSCVQGMLVQDLNTTDPALRDHAGGYILGHVSQIEGWVTEALAAQGLEGRYDARDLALAFQAAVHGGFVLAKAAQDPDAALGCLRQLRRHLEQIFTTSTTQRREP